MKNIITKTGYAIEKIAAIIKAARPAFHIPRANTKLGTIPAWNIAPVATCDPAACATCARTGCYAVKNMLCHGYDPATNNVLRAWSENTALAIEDLPGLEKKLNAYFNIMELGVNSGKYFRIHSSGDFDIGKLVNDHSLSMRYLEMWADMAKTHSEIHFLAFTKCFDLIREYDSTHDIPLYEIENLSIVLSGWDGIIIPEDLKKHYRCAYCIACEADCPEGAILCPGHCDTCGLCWNLKRIGKDTAFIKH